MEWITAIQQGISFIEDHLLEDINYKDVADHVYISPYEFHRAFSFLTGMTANTYIRNRRLSLAAREIMETEASITMIALKYGYESPESFTKAFTRFHGISPKTARDHGSRLILFNPLVIKIKVEGGERMHYRIVQKKQQQFITIKRNFENRADVPAFWTTCREDGTIDALLSVLPEGNKDLYGLCTPVKESRGLFEYRVGICKEDMFTTSELAMLEGKGFSVLDLDPTTYAVFECRGESAECIHETWTKFYQEFLPQTGYEAVAETDFEFYPQQQTEGLFCELWIPVCKTEK